MNAKEKARLFDIPIPLKFESLSQVLDLVKQVGNAELKQITPLIVDFLETLPEADRQKAENAIDRVLGWLPYD